MFLVSKTDKPFDLTLGDLEVAMADDSEVKEWTVDYPCEDVTCNYVQL